MTSSIPDPAIFGASGASGCFVKTVDFTKHGDKENPPPQVQELFNEKELLDHLSWTYGSAPAAGDDKPKRPHDVLSVYLVRNCPWARSAILSTNLTAPVPDFAAAAENTLPSLPSDPVLSIKTFQHVAPDDAPTASGLVPYAAKHSLSGISLHYPWYRRRASLREPGKGRYKLLDMLQPDGSFIEVNKARLSVLIHEPVWAEGMEEDTRLMAGVIVVFDDWLLDGDDDNDDYYSEDEDDFKGNTLVPDNKHIGCLNPIAFRFFEDWASSIYILNREVLLANFYGVLQKWEADNATDIAGMSELHLSCNKDHILHSPSTPTLAHEIHRTEQLFHAISTHLSQLPTSLPAWMPYYAHNPHGPIAKYSFRHFPAVESALNPRYVPPSQPQPKKYTIAEATTMIFAPLAERFNMLITATEKNMQLLHTVAILQESRRSVEQAESMRRLTWITFVFLPAMAVSSVFGMNVTAFRSDISIVWFFVCAVPLVGLVLGAWWGLRKWGAMERERRMGQWSEFGGARRRRRRGTKSRGWWKRSGQSRGGKKDQVC